MPYGLCERCKHSGRQRAICRAQAQACGGRQQQRSPGAAVCCPCCSRRSTRGGRPCRITLLCTGAPDRLDRDGQATRTTCLCAQRIGLGSAALDLVISPPIPPSKGRARRALLSPPPALLPAVQERLQPRRCPASSQSGPPPAPPPAPATATPARQPARPHRPHRPSWCYCTWPRSPTRQPASQRLVRRESPLPYYTRLPSVGAPAAQTSDLARIPISTTGADTTPCPCFQRRCAER